MSDKKITMPLGFLAGQNIPANMAIGQLANEILGHGADCEEQARRAERSGDQAQADVYGGQASVLRRYGWALWVISQQLDDKKAAGQALGEIVETYGLKVPQDWLKP